MIADNHAAGMFSAESDSDAVSEWKQKCEQLQQENANLKAAIAALNSTYFNFIIFIMMNIQHC